MTSRYQRYTVINNDWQEQTIQHILVHMDICLSFIYFHKWNQKIIFKKLFITIAFPQEDFYLVFKISTVAINTVYTESLF